MSRRRVTALLAIVAALLWAPSSVSAAPPDQLSQAVVTPASGGTGTVFVVTVRYRSPAGNPAAGVRLKADGQVATMVLVSGTTTDGIWSGAATLPPGAWDITVEASVKNGSRPSLLAGTVSVAGGAGPSGITGGNIPSSVAGPDGGGAGPPSSPAPQPAATAAPKATARAAPAMRSAAAALSQPPTQPAHAAAVPARPARRGEAPARSPRLDATGSSEAAQRSPAASPGASGTPAPERDADGLGLVMMIGTLAFGAAALVGSALLFAAARRDRRAATATADSAAIDPGVIASAIAERRAVRRARLRSTDDPILAAMGLPDEDTGPGAASARPVKSPAKRGRGSPKP
ncbi:MAG TPA: hypothetical protein VIH33_03040 [Candidatus Limnocylindria bacterium]|jgi:hypothetical protein